MEKNRKKFVNIPHDAGWKNVELLKERGLIPYFMHKNHGFDSYMAGAEIDNYTYLESYVKGLKMEFLKTGSTEEKIEFIRENALDIDVLMLDSLFKLDPQLLIEYKTINPDGKIYLPLDANSGWMDRIFWDHDAVRSIMNNCDVIATSCTSMQKHLNEKLPWPIYHIPNGYIEYNFLEGKSHAFENKENVILTCSRLGTDQKATDILLEAFAMIHEKIPNWSLVLIGGIEKSFEKYIENYFIKYPELKTKIKFKGIITDKEKLFQEYFNAKIFALPSRCEGGCPNVVSEALYSGCAMAVTKFDAYEDCIDFGRCGEACDINNAKDFSEILLSLANNENLKNMTERAHQYAQEHFNMEKITDRLYELLFGGQK